MLNRIITCLILLLFVFSGNAQKNYSAKRLTQLSHEELSLYYQKSLALERKGEKLALTGAAVGILGILTGALVTDNSSSGGDSNVLGSAAGAMMVGGSVATIVGISLYMIGTFRVDKINKIQYANSLQVEALLGCFHSIHTHNSQPGITFRIRF